MINKSIIRLRVTIRGAVQGVGFRPFIYRLATEFGLNGWVNNSPQGVFIEVEGSQEKLKNFLLRIATDKPPNSSIQSLESLFLDPVGYKRFEIKPSAESGKKIALVLPDIATCPDCIKEIFDPSNRRYQYPFTNCTNCGPRFSIIEALPYDRIKTTMKKFKMCELCQAEYENPLDRRFHAQPNACPVCGPHLELWNRKGKVLASEHEALLKAAAMIRAGKIVAVKGLGGFHLMVDARNEKAVLRLRRLKAREEKPLALMYPSLKSIKEHCAVSVLEARLLLSPESPIVLLKHQSSDIAQAVAPNNPNLGVMLAYTPLHHLLMAELGFPIVATSGNLSDEPICTNESEALERLGGIADLFLVHNRPIARHVDDSIVRMVMGRELVIRRARGYAPLPVHLKVSLPPVLAVGAHLKNAIGISIGKDVFISQHIGDLDTGPALAAFNRVVKSFKKLYEFKPNKIVCDLHPDYISTRFAEKIGLPVIHIQHHYAHALSVMAENELTGSILSVSWDGTGYGTDHTVWGGEFLKVNEAGFERVAQLRTFRLPGAEQAIKEPRRSALGILYGIYGNKIFAMKKLAPIKAFSAQELRIIKTMLSQNINSPIASSVGRLFDAVASITGLRQKMRFEGQAAMELEFALDGIKTNETYRFILSPRAAEDKSKRAIIIDWEPMILEIIDELKGKVSISIISAKFHNTLVEMIIKVAKGLGEERVVLTGGCFQNKYLTERAVLRLRKEGFQAYWHQRVPPNDGGIALGQTTAASSINE